jgi:hypothetical protein
MAHSKPAIANDDLGDGPAGFSFSWSLHRRKDTILADDAKEIKEND